MLLSVGGSTREGGALPSVTSRPTWSRGTSRKIACVFKSSSSCGASPCAVVSSCGSVPYRPLRIKSSNEVHAVTSLHSFAEVTMSLV